MEAIGEALSAVTTQDAQGFFDHREYRPADRPALLKACFTVGD
jgi:hypothetical protein